MNKSLIIVESPNKIKTIKSYVGEDYDVIATCGHLRELNKKYGYNKETFDPIWEIIETKTDKSKKQIINDIKTKARDAEHIYLATDPDREGEAISWHVYDILPEKYKKKCKRITFNEVTKKAILQSIQEQHEIDMNLVHSQFTRRILDRIIGYRLSTYVNAMLRAKSAGRVQSIALLFVVERELERRAFIPTFWWEIIAKLENKIEIGFVDYFEKYDPYNKTRTFPFKFAIEQQANDVYQSLTDKFKLESISEPKKSNGDVRKSITTDKLLQLGSNLLGWNTSKTTLIAQKMFEGIEYKNQHIGLISYPRTDSERLNDDFIESCKKFIEDNYGHEYYCPIVIKKTKTSVKIQDAHEAIRPVDINITPTILSTDQNVSSDILKLYNIIWTYTLSCLMNVPIYETKTFLFDNNGYKFAFNHKTLFFKGYKILNDENDKENDDKIPNIKVGDILVSKQINLNKLEKQPPAYYTEATLVAALKDAGVGRPSTYSSMAKIGESRGYINKDKQKLIPNELGINLILLLTKHFKDVISKKFTANMEIDLDKIANGDENWKDPLYLFNEKFINEVKQAYLETERIKDEEYGEDCPECHHPLVYKISRFNNKFIGCSNYPNCKYIKSDKEIKKANKLCPNCNKELLIKQNKKKQEFIACSGFPNCRYAESIDKNNKK